MPVLKPAPRADHPHRLGAGRLAHRRPLTAFKPGPGARNQLLRPGQRSWKPAAGRSRGTAMVADDTSRIKAAVEAALADGCEAVMILGGSSAGLGGLCPCGHRRARRGLRPRGHHHARQTGGGRARSAVCPSSACPATRSRPSSFSSSWCGPCSRHSWASRRPRASTVTVEPTRKIASKLGLEEFVRVKLGEVSGRIVATPLPRGAGSITSITEADGIIRIPADTEGIQENEPRDGRAAAAGLRTAPHHRHRRQPRQHAGRAGRPAQGRPRPAVASPPATSAAWAA
ncbi:MAG: hypothetical protein MZV70_22000 [Desulfobacterales bacterium]|nr:hypothetical protein [Desulfobacterales bacterium]